MPRIVGVDIPANKPVLYALRYIHGVGAKSADDICVKANLEPQRRAKELTEDERELFEKLAAISDFAPRD